MAKVEQKPFRAHSGIPRAVNLSLVKASDVAWLNLGINKGFVILGATLFAVSSNDVPEADVALSTNSRISWVDDFEAEDPNVDVFAVILHELGQ